MFTVQIQTNCLCTGNFHWNKWAYNKGRISPKNIIILHNLSIIFYSLITIEHVNCSSCTLTVYLVSVYLHICIGWVFFFLPCCQIYFKVQTSLFSANLICQRWMTSFFSLENQGCYTVSSFPAKTELGCWQLFQKVKSCQTEMKIFSLKVSCMY